MRVEHVAELSRERLPSLWTCAERYASTIPDETTAFSLIDGFLTGRLQLWIGCDESEPDTVRLALFAEIRHWYATGVTFLEITGIGGEGLGEVLPALDEIERWGAAHGARKTRVFGRPGWLRLLRDRGYHQRAIVLEKPLHQEG